MIIFYYFNELHTPMYHWQRIHHIDELQRSGHNVITFNPHEYSSYDEANEKVVGVIKNIGKVDLFLSCVDQTMIYRETVERISQMGIPTCMIAWDNLELPYKQKKIAPAFDLVWLTSSETKYLFEKWGCKKILFETYAANPFYFKPHWTNPIETVGFIGSPYGSRVNKLNDLLKAKISCGVYSNVFFSKGYNSSKGGEYKIDYWDIIVKTFRYLKFPIGRKVLFSTLVNKVVKKSSLDIESECLRRFKSVSDEEMISLYSNLILSLNITELRDTYILRNPIHKIHLRTFEVPMSGGLEFASYNDEIASYFEDGKEIVLYRDKEEMVDKAHYYLDPKNENEVMQMKKAAYTRAENEHTWMCRYRKIFDALGLQ